MKIKNIEDLRKNISRSTASIFIMVFSTAFIGLYLTHSKFIKNQNYSDNSKIISAVNIYKSNVSEKLSIIASSNVFLDYLRSGGETRRRLYNQFLSQLSTLKSKSIIGMKLTDSNGHDFFNYGNHSKDFINLKLCYLNTSLDSSMGECKFTWRLFFNKKDLLTEFLSSNHEIKLNHEGTEYNLFDGNYFGSFPINSSSDFRINLGIDHEKDYFFFIYVLLITLTLLTFGVWSWYRLSNLLNKYIANPINSLTNCLKSDNLDKQEKNIDEIQYLIAEINVWKSKLNKIESDKNAAKLGRIAAQLAHDVRSPLSAIDMLVKNLPNAPENYKVILRSATQRISDIANNFLSEYAMSSQVSKSDISSQHIPSVLESIISEKRSQYLDRNINISLFINTDAYNIFSIIGAADFNRVLSNLINNSIEAINGAGEVSIVLSKIDKMLRIDISDNGCGIPDHLISLIVNGGVSIGKKNGSGLGLSHAIKTVKDWHGYTDILSDEGNGTKISIQLPISNNVPDWFELSLKLTRNSTICILDDEYHTHDLWKYRLQTISQSYNTSFNINHFTTIDEFYNFMRNSSALDCYYFIDYDLGRHDVHGIFIIEKLKIHKSATLVTNRYDDHDIQNSCVSLGIKIIPKNYIEHVPIKII